MAAPSRLALNPLQEFADGFFVAPPLQMNEIPAAGLHDIRGERGDEIAVGNIPLDQKLRNDDHALSIGGRLNGEQVAIEERRGFLRKAATPTLAAQVSASSVVPLTDRNEKCRRSSAVLIALAMAGEQTPTSRSRRNRV